MTTLDSSDSHTTDQAPLSFPGAEPRARLARLFDEAQPHLEELLNFALAGSGLLPSDADDFRSLVSEKLLDRDFYVLRQYDGRGKLRSFLAVVIQNSLRDFQNKLWGKWRPSAMAQREGEVAIRLEELMYRDNYPPREAVQKLLMDRRDLKERELYDLVQKLPRRENSTEVPLDKVPGSEFARLHATPESDESHEAEIVEMAECVHQALQVLSSEDRVIASMHFVDRVSLASVARALKLEQRPLYRRKDRITEMLRKGLEARGFTEKRIRELLQAPSEP